MSMTDTAHETTARGASRIARIREILVAAEAQGRPDEAVLEDIALVVGERRDDAEVYQKPLG